MRDGVDSWQLIFFASAAVLVLLQARRGWRLGFVRQLISILALAGSYLAAFFGGPLLIPLLRPIGLPDQLLRVAGGMVLGAAVYLGIAIFGALLFKKTSQQGIGLIRLGYGATGAVLGGLFGLFIVWAAVVAIHVLGTLAETDVNASRPPVAAIDGRKSRRPAPEPPSVVAQGLVHMKHSLEQGPAGAVFEKIDPIPSTLYRTLAQLGQMMASEQSVERFLKYPGMETVTTHPKITALQNDPTITRDVLARNYLGLLRNEKIVAAANDAELGGLLRKLEFQKALDQAVSKPAKQDHATTVR